MTAEAARVSAPFGPWNPGVRSPIPEELRQYCTIFLPANVSTSFREALELRDFTGLEFTELVAFRPQRLVLHELLIRVTADLSVPDGHRVEDLGLNFREMTRGILARHIEPHMSAITASYDAMRLQLERVIQAEFAAEPVRQQTGFARRRASARGSFFGLFSAREKRAPVPSASGDWDVRLSEWTVRAGATDDELKASALRALARVVAAIYRRHGRPWGTADLITAIAIDVASNEHGSDLVGRAIQPLLLQAVKSEGYSLLPAQPSPVIMNTKGPSASGKSTLRPLQRQLAHDIGANWRDFALISPDIWRKQLLNYGALGADYKYAGSFTGEELQLVDQKLDRYMARKAMRGQMSHLLIDRFRFDSFAADSDEAGSNLLTRFGRIIYLFFVITPPALLVERAWNRGLDVGRYKAVDDTLAHGVEAYSGMPQLFFTWVQRADKSVHFEFLDNSVRQGARPRTVAFGGNDTMNVLDIRCILDIERHRKANINATAAEFLYTDSSVLAPERNLEFLSQCIERFRYVNFADQETGRVYLSVASGEVAWLDARAFEEALSIPENRAALLAVVPAVADFPGRANARPRLLQNLVKPEQLGRWGRGVD